MQVPKLPIVALSLTDSYLLAEASGYTSLATYFGHFQISLIGEAHTRLRQAGHLVNMASGRALDKMTGAPALHVPYFPEPSPLPCHGRFWPFCSWPVWPPSCFAFSAAFLRSASALFMASAASCWPGLDILPFLALLRGVWLMSGYCVWCLWLWLVW